MGSTALFNAVFIRPEQVVRFCCVYVGVPDKLLHKSSACWDKSMERSFKRCETAKKYNSDKIEALLQSRITKTMYTRGHFHATARK